MTAESGMLAVSKAGHDKGQVYVIVDADPAYVYLADGKIRTVCRTKKKKRKHIQLVGSLRCGCVTDDSKIRAAIRQYQKKADPEEENNVKD